VPDGVSGRVQYGTNVKAAAVYARAAQFLPYGRVAALMTDLLGVGVSVGFVHQVVAEAARRLGPFVSRLTALLHVQGVLHADETPARLAGGFKYVHVACTPGLTLFHVGGPHQGRHRRRRGAARVHRHPGPSRLRRLPASDRG
jgi:transposase